MQSCNKLPSDKYTDSTLNITFYITAFIKIKVSFKQNNNVEMTPIELFLYKYAEVDVIHNTIWKQRLKEH
jgi:hypothetical protein